jgi:hypothetical protein
MCDIIPMPQSWSTNRALEARTFVLAPRPFEKLLDHVAHRAIGYETGIASRVAQIGQWTDPGLVAKSSL